MVKVKGHGHQVKNVFQVSFDRLTCNVQGQESSVKVRGQVGYAQPKGHDICRWAHINVRLLHFKSNG